MTAPRPRRRTSAIGAAALAAALCGCSPSAPTGASAQRATAASTAAARSARTLDARLDALERERHARIGVEAWDTGTGASVGHRAGERFAYDSTHKVLSSALLLKTRTDAQLDAVIHYTPADLLSYAPITSAHVATGMTLRALIAAALQYSDNTAANLLTAQLGGPAAEQAQLRALGDALTRVDRVEPDLNSATPGDPRDTTTPTQMAADLRLFLLGGALPTARRQLLLQLMLGNTTGAPYIRAGVPSTWDVADKTGNGSWGTRNDVAVVLRPRAAPLVVAVYTARASQDAASDDDLIARTTRDVVAALGPGGQSHR